MPRCLSGFPGSLEQYQTPFAVPTALFQREDQYVRLRAL
jgi:hypothetical protein